MDFGICDSLPMLRLGTKWRVSLFFCNKYLYENMTSESGMIDLLQVKSMDVANLFSALEFERTECSH